MIITLIILMCIVTLYSIGVIVENTKKVTVGQTEVKRALTGAGCIAIALMCIAYNAACLFIMVKVV